MKQVKYQVWRRRANKGEPLAEVSWSKPSANMFWTRFKAWLNRLPVVMAYETTIEKEGKDPNQR